MEYRGVNELRKMFEDFFVSKDHFPRGSFSLIPEKDKSLLLINSGMAPLKPYFSGAETPPKKRMTTCQKCIRTGDIDNVGKTDRHATFFEMLGNFSFGDYFKREAIQWGWEFITEILGMPEDKLWATIYEEDDEAFDLWREVVNMPAEKIVRLGKEDNFWEIGTGPCGPCSEVYFDRGEAYGCGKESCQPGCDCDRYLEFWNYVFTQFDKQEDGTYVPLAHPNIDTGMGLERLACIMQHVDSIYAIDTIRAILDEVVRLSGKEYQEGDGPFDVSLRVVTDHVRAVSFMIADGIMPSNEGRGYVLRRLLRRAARHGRLLGLHNPFLADLAKIVVKTSSLAYPELAVRFEHVHKIISIEEEKFAKTIDQGSEILEGYISDNIDNGLNELTGEQLFKLYDTYGFPPELTKEIALEHGCSVDEEGFYERMKEQKEQARAARKIDDENGWSENDAVYAAFAETEFLGYDHTAADCRVLGIVRQGRSVETLTAGEEAYVILDRTPFYAEGGGQVGDVGLLEAEDAKAEVLDTLHIKHVHAHKVRMLSGSFNAGECIHAKVDPFARNATARNHTATHLLHKALRQVLGAHVEQAGSYVMPDILRFDFTHYESLSIEQIDEIERIINKEILQFKKVSKQMMSIDEAKEMGAVALFGEKYGDTVRVVTIPEFSSELCGGIHVDNTGQIGAIRILSENSVAAGIRRIEAITGHVISTRLRSEQAFIKEMTEALKTNRSNAIQRIEHLHEDIRVLKKEIDDYKRTSASSYVENMLHEALSMGGAVLVTGVVSDATIEELRSFADEIKQKEKRSIAVLATSLQDGKSSLIVSVSDELLEEGYHAGKWVKEIASAAGGGGGGKANMAQAGIADAMKIPVAFEEAKRLFIEAAK